MISKNDESGGGRGYGRPLSIKRFGQTKRGESDIGQSSGMWVGSYRSFMPSKVDWPNMSLRIARYVGHLKIQCQLSGNCSYLVCRVTVYKGLKETETKPGEWVAISGIGGLGHVAVQYAKAMVACGHNRCSRRQAGSGEKTGAAYYS
ncbi:hypothetical protein FQR65_LT18766 [Abscondita terminalis]|nr:hypothetical protein FQR65_LT18973 [Abscondita terminalis]KAF5305178.1 hypothetical protein FQR65_LT18766 [Abscondita terminalis]